MSLMFARTTTVLLVLTLSVSESRAQYTDRCSNAAFINGGSAASCCNAGCRPTQCTTTPNLACFDPGDYYGSTTTDQCTFVEDTCIVQPTSATCASCADSDRLVWRNSNFRFQGGETSDRVGDTSIAGDCTTTTNNIFAESCTVFSGGTNTWVLGNRDLPMFFAFTEDAVAGDVQTFTLTFIPPAKSVCFELLDVDFAATFWRDQVSITTVHDGTLTSSEVKGNNVGGTYPNYFGQNGNAANDQTLGNVLVSIAADAIHEVTIAYTVDDVDNAGGQLLGIGDISFCPGDNPCLNKNPGDVVIILDRSGSFANDFDEQKAGVVEFIDLLGPAPGVVEVAILEFSQDEFTARVQDWTGDAATANAAVNALTATGGTTNYCAALAAAEQQLASGRANVPKIVVFLTDGEPTDISCAGLPSPFDGSTCRFACNNCCGGSNANCPLRGDTSGSRICDSGTCLDVNFRCSATQADRLRYTYGAEVFALGIETGTPQFDFLREEVVEHGGKTRMWEATPQNLGAVLVEVFVEIHAYLTDLEPTTSAPTISPTIRPTFSPTASPPSRSPTTAPTSPPTPSASPTPAPSSPPSPSPTPAPTTGGSLGPSVDGEGGDMTPATGQQASRCGDGLVDGDEQCEVGIDMAIAACCVDCTALNESEDCVRAREGQGGTNDSPPSPDDSSDDGTATLVLVVVVVVALVFCGAGLYAMWFARRRLLQAGAAVTASSGGTIEDISLRSIDNEYVAPPSRPSSNSSGGSHILSGAFSRMGAPASLLIPGSEVTCTTKLGEGAFGIVRQGQWKDKAVAVKQVKGTDKEAMRQLLDEGEKLIKLPPHDNLVTFYGVCDTPPSIVLQFCNGGSLLDRLYGPRALHSAPLTKAEQCSISLAVARGIQHLHKARIVHRDIAARNVLLHDDVPKVTDMGMARDSSSDEGEAAAYVQQTKSNTGPLKWMAPEQLRSRTVSYKADVYAYGILLFELWGKREPWTGMSAIEAAAAVLAGTAHRIPSSAPAAVAATMAACFEADPHLRPSTRHIVDGFESADFEVGQTDESVQAYRQAAFARSGRLAHGGPTTVGYEAPPSVSNENSPSPRV